MPRFSADLGQLSRIRDFVTETATRLGVEPEAMNDLRLAVDEAVTNVVVHGYGSSAGEISLELHIEGSDLVITLQDDAPPFDPTSAEDIEPGALEDRTTPGGFGLFLIRKAMDDVKYRDTGTGNELTLRKRNVFRAAP